MRLYRRLLAEKKWMHQQIYTSEQQCLIAVEDAWSLLCQALPQL